MDSSRNVILAILVVVIAIAVFYMIDPTFGGLFGANEGFQDKVTQAMTPGSVSGTNPTLTAQSGDLVKKALENAQSLMKAQAALGGKKSVQGFQNMAPQPTEMPPMQEPAVQVEAPMPAMDASAMPQAQPTEPAVSAGMNGGMAGAGPKKNGMNVEGFADYEAGSPVDSMPANCYPKNQLAPQELLPTDQYSKWAAVNPMGAGDISGKNFLSAGSLIGVNTVGQSLRNANQQLRSEPPCPQQQVSIWNQSTIEPDLTRRPLEQSW
jgi:hypothetical protein